MKTYCTPAAEYTCDSHTYSGTSNKILIRETRPVILASREFIGDVSESSQQDYSDLPLEIWTVLA